MHTFSKWYFDFLKNAIAVGALMAIAKKTNSHFLEVLAWISFAILNLNVLPYMTSWHFEPFHVFGNSKFASAIGGILWSVIATAAMVGIQWMLFNTICAIVDGNTK